MSLRKSPRMTPALLAANHRNARRSTGPRTAAGKQVARFNGLKHGGYAADRHHRETMLRLGEDPQVFERFKQEITAALGPDDVPSAAQLECVAKKYWRRERLALAQRRRARSASRRVEKPQVQPGMAGAAVAA